ncbi:vitamin K-dependent gamma-carboxylase-like protein [Roseimicrobium gellanilyticum]|uniref:Vitamin K-dependent gamma-carboxylase-like protein n=1 Tax=Roseimicrobium gellanilyticum TaxID=748857 RepID=A0A366HUC6_9BACT|nr:HTTM domain-containing protein [Roseimicrobium gellanilyticum]RBP47697.1 vitamin K-dependent gamma-carboxylase-like protein [Roseimicrobium gellanilyticum]
MESSQPRSLRERLFAPVDIAFLVFFRLGFAGIMLWEVYRYFSLGRIKPYYVDPGFHFKYYGFEWIEPWPGEGMYWHFTAMAVFATCMLVGFCYRLAAFLFACAFTFVFLQDQAHYLNHFYLVCLISFLMVLLPANCAWSIDAWMRPRLRSQVVPAWTLWLLRVQIGIVYFYGGLAKLGPDWLQGEPMRMWLADRASKFPRIEHYFSEEWFVYGFAYGGLLFDLLVVPLLLWRPTRWIGYLWALSFHLINNQLFNIGIFPWFMLCATLIYLPPDFPKRIWGFLRGKKWQPQAEALSPVGAAATAGSWSFGQRVLVSFLGLYLVAQCLIPFRHLLYPGDVNWTEEGHRFSWRMKLRGKDGEVVFKVVQKGTGRFWEFDPEGNLTKKQVDEMAGRPDMILQFAHHLAWAMSERGYGDVAVYAKAMVSLNGREPELLVDPMVDLAQVRRSLAHSTWILPLQGKLRKPQIHHEEDDSHHHHVTAE